MLLGLLLGFMVLGASGKTTINGYLVDIRNGTLISVRSTSRSSHQLNLSGMDLREISSTAFMNAANIKILNLANNSIDALTGSVFSSLRNLEHLSLADNAMKHFTGAFVGLDNLKTLNISNNPFTVLEPGALLGLSNTVDVFVRGNSLKAIFTDVFVESNSLNEILTNVFRQRNPLKSIFTDFFDPNKSLLWIIGLGSWLWRAVLNFVVLGKPWTQKSIDISELNVDLRRIFIDDFNQGKSLKKISTEDEDRDEDEVEDNNNDKAPKSGRALESVAEPQWRFKVCMNQGKVMILERVKSKEVLQAGCRLLQNKPHNLGINNLGIKEFERGWYQLPNDQYPSRITFSDNDIVHVTAEMLNDLPASMELVDLSNNMIERLKQGVIKNANIKWLNLSNNLISEIEENALARINLDQLYLNDNRLTDTRFLANLPPGVNRLSLNRNQIAEFTSEPLVHFRRLEIMEVTDNRITTLRNNSFKGLTHLLELDLSRNRIGTLEPGCFRDLKAVRILSLRDNEISDLDAGVFEDFSRLRDLDLGGNRLRTITEGFRNSLPRDLHTLDLDRNEIGSLKNGSFGDVPKDRLNLENNRITSIAKGSFIVPKLRYLDDSVILGPLFAGSQLVLHLVAASSILLPRISHGIGVVHLSGNPIKRLENGALFGLQRQGRNYVYVERNSIEVIQGGLFADTDR